MTLQQINPLLRRAFMFLEDGDWQTADEYCERVLDVEPENALAYLGKLMAALHVETRERLAELEHPFDNDPNYSKVMRFGDATLKTELQIYNDYINKRNESARLESLYQNACRVMKRAVTEQEYKNVARDFDQLGYFKDAQDKAVQCRELAESVRKDAVYNDAKANMHVGSDPSCERAIEQFKSIPGWRDANDLLIACQRKRQEIQDRMEAQQLAREMAVERAAKRQRRKKVLAVAAILAIAAFLLMTYIIQQQKYNAAVALMNAGKYGEAYAAFLELGKYSKAETIFDKVKKEEFAKAAVGDYIEFGQYEQDSNSSNGKESIEWLVLDKIDNRLLVISKYALDAKPYNDYRTEVTWETCTLRKWLNTEFLNTAFSQVEQSIIPKVVVSADPNPEYTTDPGISTLDKVFLLSVNEFNQYFTPQTGSCRATAYAIKQGAYVSDNDVSVRWWVRSPGASKYYAAEVALSLGINEYYNSVHSSGIAVRPALWIDLHYTADHSKEVIYFPTQAPTATPQITATPTTKPIATATTNGKNNLTKKEILKQDGKNIAEGDYVIFGAYEQDNNASNGAEDIEWIVLDKEKNRFLLLSRYALDCKPYNTTKTSVTWEQSSLRNWLNSSFFYTSFDNEEQKAILDVLVPADKNPDSVYDPGNSTYDKVFILSVAELSNYRNVLRGWQCSTTAYARKQGAYAKSGGCYWWLRTPGNYLYDAAMVDTDGSVWSIGIGVNNYEVAVRPALWIELNVSDDDAGDKASTLTPTPSSNSTSKPSASKMTTQTCQASGCNREGTKKITGFSGAIEYYCTTHYNEMVDIWDSIATKYMACEFCGKKTNCTYTTSLGLSFWVCSSCRSWMLGN